MKSIYMSQRRRRETELTSEWNEKGERRRMQTKINASVVGSHTERQALTATEKEKESSSVWEKTAVETKPYIRKSCIIYWQY